MAEAEGSRIEIVADRDDRPTTPTTRQWAWVAGTLGVVVLVAVLLSLASDDPPPPPPEPSPGIFDLRVADAADSPPSIDTTYPVLGRPWGQTLLWVQQGGIVAFDPDTGESWLWPPIDETIAPGWSGVHIIGGVPHVTFGGNGVARIDGSTTTVVRDDGPADGTEPSGWIVGEYLVDPGGNLAPPVLLNLRTGGTVPLDDVSGAAVLGADVLLERGDRIRVRTASGEERDWARGELMWGGSLAVVWRHCDDSSDCEAWAGTADDPRSILLDHSAVALAETRDLENSYVPKGPLINQSKGSPGARYAGSLDGIGEPAWSLIDLVDGSEVELRPRGLPSAWAIDEVAFLKAVSPTLTLVSMDDGAAARLPILTSAGPRWEGGAVFVPTDELPVIE